MPDLKAARLAAIGKLRGMFSKKLHKGSDGEFAEARPGPREEPDECNCGGYGCKECAKAVSKNR